MKRHLGRVDGLKLDVRYHASLLQALDRHPGHRLFFPRWWAALQYSDPLRDRKKDSFLPHQEQVVFPTLIDIAYCRSCRRSMVLKAQHLWTESTVTKVPVNFYRSSTTTVFLCVSRS